VTYEPGFFPLVFVINKKERKYNPRRKPNLRERKKNVTHTKEPNPFVGTGHTQQIVVSVIHKSRKKFYINQWTFVFVPTHLSMFSLF